MTKEEARKRLEEIKQEQEELQDIINKPDRWQDSLVQPEEEEYFYLTGNTYNGLFVSWSSLNKRKPEYAFRRKDQAELIKEKMLLMQEMHAFAYIKNEVWMPDWDDGHQKKHGIFQGIHEVGIQWSYFQNLYIFGIAVKSREIAEEMLEIFGERIEKFYNKLY